MIHNYKELKVWQEARILVKDIYEETKGFPKEEQFGLTNQIRRASVSIASNLAEGTSRTSQAEFARYVTLSLGSAYEVECQITLAFDLKFIEEMQYKKLIDNVVDIQKKLFNLRKAILKDT